MKRVILRVVLIITLAFSLLWTNPVSNAMAALSADEADAFKVQITATGGDLDAVIRLLEEMIRKHPDEAAEIAALAAEVFPELAVDIAVAAAEMVPYLAEEIIVAVSAVVPAKATQIRYAVEALLEAMKVSPTPILDEPQEIPAPAPAPIPPPLPQMPPPVSSPPTTQPYGQ